MAPVMFNVSNDLVPATVASEGHWTPTIPTKTTYTYTISMHHSGELFPRGSKLDMIEEAKLRKAAEQFKKEKATFARLRSQRKKKK